LISNGKSIFKRIMRGLVSIVVPALNRGFVIGRALESLLAQTYEDWETLIVNDGSNDQTSDVVKEYSKRDRRITLIQHDRRKGAQAARNTGLRQARGQWIAFLDSDDQWLAHSLEARLSFAGKSCVVHSECYVLEEEGPPRLFGVPPLRGRVYPELLRSPGPMFQSLLFSREACSRLGWLDENIVAYQEWDTAIRLAKHCSFEFVAEPTFIYDCRHAKTISKDSLQAAVGYEQVVNKHRWAMLRHLGPEPLARHYQRAAYYYMQAEQEMHGRRCLLRAAMWWPFRLSVVPATKSFVANRISRKLTHAHRNSS
jgi:glycosyltransferase involved in cell wall biosynthesis